MPEAEATLMTEALRVTVPFATPAAVAKYARIFTVQVPAAVRNQIAPVTGSAATTGGALAQAARYADDPAKLAEQAERSEGLAGCARRASSGVPSWYSVCASRWWMMASTPG